MNRSLFIVWSVVLTAFPVVAISQEGEKAVSDEKTSRTDTAALNTGERSDAEEMASDAPQPETGPRGDEPKSPAAAPVAAKNADTSAEPPTEDHSAEMPGNQRITWEMRRQVPFVRNGGLLNRKETAVMLYVDGDIFPPAVMASIQRGLFYWMTVGLDVGGDMGVFQAILRIKQEMARTRNTNFFFWGWHVRTGYKYVNVDFTKTMGDVWIFDDNSWILTFENTFAFRFGKHRRRAFYINSIIYGDFDLRGEGRQIDAYVYPATLGFETIIGQNWNFFIEAGVILSINGWEVNNQRVISENGDFFPSGSLGVAYRFGGVSTALPENWRDPSAPPMR